jgi:D-aminoacyl-tRNA deacylase
MKALIQRVSTANVKVDGKIIGEIDHGLLVFLGVKNGDTEKDAEYLADKIVNLRIFAGDNGHFDKSLLDLKTAGVLIVSQFTLYGSTKKGRRPDFTEAAQADYAENLYDYFVHKMRETGIKTETGKFQEMMEVSLVNDGPVTFMLES